MAKTAKQPVDKYFLILTLLIAGLGLFAFVSASLGILARSETKFYGVLVNQLAFGFAGGLAALFVAMKIPYTFWRKYSFYIFLGAVILSILVFVPGIGFAHGGARRWLDIGPLSFQPAEALKISFVMYFSGWLVWAHKKQKQKKVEFKYKIIPLIGLLVIVAGLLLKQPDTKSLVLIIAASVAMLFVSGISWKILAGFIGGGLIIVAGLAFFRPYVMQRIKTFIDPSSDPRGASYQLQQSLIAIGSGGIWGRGLGQSVQKFNYLPEPQGDSVFAVIGEEFGFIGTSILVVLYVFFAIRGYKIAATAPDRYSMFLVAGLVTILVAQSFLNMAALIGIFPLTGVPLVFISQGGTSLLMAFATVGIILNVSSYRRSAVQRVK
jgi:cell division protein FtsW